MSATWTHERVETLRRMWGDKKSAAEIAKELGGVTRCSVIGKISRLGLSEKRPEKVVVVQPAAAPVSVAPARPLVAQRCDVRVAQVPYPTSNSGVALSMPVSLPREPWLSGGVA